MNEHEMMGVTREQERELTNILFDSSLYMDMSQTDWQKLLHNLVRGPETFTSIDVGSCFIINASDVFLTSQASNKIYYVTTDHGTPRYNCVVLKSRNCHQMLDEHADLAFRSPLREDVIVCE